jgi:ribonuclease P protein component
MSTIKSGREIETIFKTAQRGTHPLLVVLVVCTPDDRGPLGRVAFVAGKRLGGAVERNRSKRVMRETVRRAGGPWPGKDVVLIARPGTRAASPDAVDSALRRVLRKTGVAA